MKMLRLLPAAILAVLLTPTARPASTEAVTSHPPANETAPASIPIVPANDNPPTIALFGLRYAPESKGGHAAATHSLSLVRASHRPMPDFDSLQVMRPIGLYGLDLSELANGHGFKPTTVVTSYYYLVKAGDEAIAAVDVSVDHPGQETMRSVSMGLQMQLAEIAHDKLPALAQVRAGSYEARLLIEHLTLAAIWLKSDHDGADLIYPVITFTPWLEGKVEEKLYTVSDFVKIFGPIAKESLAARSQPWGGN